MSKKSLLVGGAVLLALGAGLAVTWPFGRGGVLVLPGIVEIQEVRLGSKLGGRVAKTLVKEGAEVKPGDILVVFETPELETQRDQLRAKVEAAEEEYQRAVNGARVEEKEAARAAEMAAKARYDRSKQGWRVEEKSMARSELESAEADFEQAKKDLERIGQLMQTRSASRFDHDTALAARDRFRGRMANARARVEMYAAGSREEDIAEAEADWKKAKANYEILEHGTRSEDIRMARARANEIKGKLQEIEVNLREGTVRVPTELGQGVVEILSVRPGDLVAANQPIIRILRTQDLWVKVFVPETKLGHVRLDQHVDVKIDTYPRDALRGVVYQRAAISEFTPRNVQSVDERRFQVFGVKIRVDDPKGILNAGMAAEVTVPLEP